MPQMKPILWLLLLMIFSLLIFSFSILNYFNFNFSKKEKFNNLKNLKINLNNWKW